LQLHKSYDLLYVCIKTILYFFSPSHLTFHREKYRCQAEYAHVYMRAQVFDKLPKNQFFYQIVREVFFNVLKINKDVNRIWRTVRDAF
jgi:hypothetical protein